ncbi:MAG: type III pantothenate kinase, partial [Oscillospiraceae bacterium]
MILCIDIGNSNIVMGGYKNDKLRFSTRLSTDRSLEAAQYALQINGILSLYHVGSEAIEGIALSSVVPGLTTDIMAALKILCDIEPMLLTIDNSNIEVSIDNPRELGNDILATAIAVKHSYALPSVI